MKAIAYHLDPSEKESLVLANQKKHDITLIASPLSIETLKFAAGKEVILAFSKNHIEEALVQEMQQMGIKYLATNTSDLAHLPVEALRAAGIKISNVPFADVLDTFQRMSQVITNLALWESGTCVGKACCCHKTCKIPHQNS